MRLWSPYFQGFMARLHLPLSQHHTRAAHGSLRGVPSLRHRALINAVGYIAAVPFSWADSRAILNNRRRPLFSDPHPVIKYA